MADTLADTNQQFQLGNTVPVLTFEIEPKANSYFDAEAEIRSELVTSQPPTGYITMYATRVAQYELERQPSAGTKLIKDDYPRHDVFLNGENITLIYGPDLYVTLLEIYVLHGPEGLEHVYSELKNVSDMQTPSYYWSAAISFFMFSRNLLMLVIRDSLDELEKKAWDLIFPRLSNNKIRVEEEIRRLKITPHKRTVPSDSILFYGTMEINNFTIDDPEMSKALYSVINNAVTARYKVLEAQEILKKAETETRARRLAGESGGTHGESGSGNKSNGGGGGGSGGNEDYIDPYIAMTWLTEASKVADTANEKAFILCSFAPTAVLMLKPGFSEAEMAQALGSVMWNILETIENTGARLNTSRGWIQTEIPDPQPEERLETYFSPLWTIESAVAQHVVSKPDQHGYLTLLNEDALNEIIENGMISIDSFAYIVCYHYRRQLRNEINAKKAILNSNLFKVLSKVQAALSIWIFYSARVSPILTLLSAVLGIGLATLQGYLVFQSIGLQLANNILTLDLDSADAISNVHELAKLRGNFLDNIGNEVARELVAVALSSAWVPFRAMLDARSFYSDLEILFGG